MIVPKNLKTQLFNLIERNETDELISFIDRNADYIATMTAQNYWTLGMYAVRYGNHKLMKFLHSKNLLIDHPYAQYSLLYTACLNNDNESFKMLIDEFGKDVNSSLQYAQDNTLLKYAFKMNLPELMEILCSRGAYYIIQAGQGVVEDSFANNMICEEDQQSGVKYRSYSDGKEISKQLILSLGKDKQTPIHYQRYKNVFLLHYLKTKMKQEFTVGADNLQIDQYFSRVLQYIAPNVKNT